MDNNSIDLEEIVDGRPLREWLKSDEGMVDYDKLEFGHNVSNTEDYLIYDLGSVDRSAYLTEMPVKPAGDGFLVAAFVCYHKNDPHVVHLITVKRRVIHLIFNIFLS